MGRVLKVGDRETSVPVVQGVIADGLKMLRTKEALPVVAQWCATHGFRLVEGEMKWRKRKKGSLQ